AWDLSAQCRVAWSCSVSPGAWVRHLAWCPSSRCLLVGHSDGICWVDGRSGAAVEQVACLGQAYASVGVAENVRIVAFGKRLLALDRRRICPEDVAELDTSAISLQCCMHGAQTSMLVGTKDGNVQLYAVHV
ncbi:unnamed protein product, partial [Symbiodinium pilosum]